MIAAVVTGAAVGIGRAVTARLIEEGATVVGVDRDQAALDEAVSQLGDRLVPIVGDIGEWSTHERAADAAEQHGELAWWVNNAGIDWVSAPTRPPRSTSPRGCGCC